METRAKPRWLLLAQCDSITGEDAGRAMQALYDAGAMNVQILSTVAKKNRPGSIFLIDADAASLDAVESCVVRELGVTGWHRVASEHRYVAVDFEERTLRISAAGETFAFTATRKISSAEPAVVRLEHDCCLALQSALRDRGVAASLPLIRQRLTQAFLSGNQDEMIEF